MNRAKLVETASALGPIPRESVVGYEGARELLVAEVDRWMSSRDDLHWLIVNQPAFVELSDQALAKPIFGPPHD